VIQAYQYSLIPQAKNAVGWRYLYLNKMDASKFRLLEGEKWLPEPDLTKTEQANTPKYITSVLALATTPNKESE